MGDRLRELIEEQAGVVSRAQVIGLGHDDAMIEGLLRRRSGHGRIAGWTLARSATVL